ncbi:hypothetical protein MLD38_000065 [Melastoma candidum]|uniref:Uncharacterized protein n=1 Tax=Melastoma candidum TaxID=119954 RepID=A0ACB9SA61_9MYRT|nr:hypothetical protein MLD38_000065 [Melastoma candidum]
MGAGTGSPSRNPTTSPIILRRRRRKTLRMFLSHDPSDGRCESPDRLLALPPSDGAGGRGEGDSDGSKVGPRTRHKLKDLLVSTSSGDEAGEERMRRAEPLARLLGSGRRGAGTRRLRCRLMRGSWRPVLVAIPE